MDYFSAGLQTLKSYIFLL